MKKKLAMILAGAMVLTMALTACGAPAASGSGEQTGPQKVTLATGGTRMKATFLNRVVSSDYRTLVYQNEPVVASTLKMSNATYGTIVQGMKQVITGPSGTARNTMRGTSVEVAAKTGTAETGRLGSDDGSFVCCAPADDPEIAIAVFGETAAPGATLGRVAKDVIDYYFYQAQASSVVTHETQLS